MSKKKKTDGPNLDFLDLPADPKEGLRRILAFEAWGVVLLALSVVYILGLTGHGGPVGEIIILLVRPVIGIVGSWLLAVALVIGTVHLLAAGSWPLAGGLTRLAFWVMPLILAGWESTMHLRSFYWDVQAQSLTGWIGLWFGRGLRFLVGEYALPVAISLTIAITFIVLRLSLKVVLAGAWNGIKHLFNLTRQQSEEESPYPQVIETVEDLIYEDPMDIDPVMAEVTNEAVEEPSELDFIPSGSQLDLGLDEAPVLPKPKKYKLPPVKLLSQPLAPVMDEDHREFAANRIVKTLETFGIPSKVNDVITGPAVTRVEVVLGEGIRVKQVEGMEKDIAYILPAKRVRVEAPIPGKTAVGIEFPNIKTNIVRLRELIETPEWQKAKAPLTMALAKSLNNKPVLADLGKMPHLLVAGQTGSGKSVCLHAITMSLLYRLTPDQLRLILIDPKMVEFGFYEGLPHLLTPVVNDVGDAVNTLRWSVQEMRERYHRLKDTKARNIQVFNRMMPVDQRMPFIVIVIDEMADLMSQEGYEIEACITSLTQLARAVGIHLVLATQRPSVKIITGNIKANIPARVALNVASYTDSRTILDYKGAETLLGNGDMLFKPIDADAPIRAQGAYVDDEEIKRIVDFLSHQGEPEYDDTVIAEHSPTKSKKGAENAADVIKQDREIFSNALTVFMNEGEASTSMLQSKLGLGYPRARRIMTQMEDLGLVGPKNGSKPREIIYTACREVMANLKGGNVEEEKKPVENNVDEILAEV